MGMPERNRTVERDRAVLERILALLLALAVLADRAACLPFLKRLPLLATLECGEAEARMLIVELASGAPAREPDMPLEAGDAAGLAARFRMLALALHALLAQIRGGSPRRQALLPAETPECRSRRPEGWQAFLTLPAPDTS